MKLIAIDPGRYMGWATWDGKRLRSGVEDLCDPDDDDMAARYGRCQTFVGIWLLQEVLDIARDEPCALALESQLAQRGHGKWNIGYQAVLMLGSMDWGLRFLAVQPSELKLWATGDGRAGKNAMVAKANEIATVYRCLIETDSLRHVTPREITDDNEADAVCILAWAMEQLRQGVDTD